MLGSTAGDGSVRHGADVERVLEIDEGGLRVRTMAQSGWGRTSLVHGPLEPLPGRLLHVHLLNGHNTSDSSAVGPLWRRLARWLVGSETVPVWRRVVRYPRSRPREWLPRKL
ncbi:MAG: oxidoreductase, partial [Acidimicrobiia bacterium]